MWKWNVWGIRVTAHCFVTGRCLLGFTILLGWYSSIVMTHPGRKTENASWKPGENWMMMTQNLHPEVKWRLKHHTNLLSRVIWSTHEVMSFQFIEALHWSSDEKGNIRKLELRWKAGMIADKLQSELMFLLPFSFQYALFVLCVVSPASAAAEIQGKVFQCLEVLWFDLLG